MEYLVALIGLLDPETKWAVTIMTYETVAECERVMDAVIDDYRAQWPKAVLWCTEPVRVTTASAVGQVRPLPNPFY